MAKILVIDDSPEIRNLLEEALTAVGHEVRLAADGKEGMEEFRLRPADIVVTDLFMPNREGLETIAILVQAAPHVAILAMSGNYSAIPMLEVARGLGAREVLQKPFLSHQLIDAINRLLESREQPTSEPESARRR